MGKPGQIGMNQPEKPKRKTGRPPKFPGDGPRITHSLRVGQGVDGALREAARLNNRTLAEELEVRVTRSFEASLLELPPALLDQVTELAGINARPVADQAHRLIEAGLSSVKQPSGMTNEELARYLTTVVMEGVSAAFVGSTMNLVKNIIDQDPSTWTAETLVETVTKEAKKSTSVILAIRDAAAKIDAKYVEDYEDEELKSVKALARTRTGKSKK